MSRIDTLIDELADDARPVQPLASPLKRAFSWLAVIGLVSGGVIVAASDFQHLTALVSGRDELIALEMAAMLLTGTLAILAAFSLAIPGRSHGWLLAPVVPFLAWLLLSSAGCYRLFATVGSFGRGFDYSVDCLLFILIVSLPLGAPLIWLLARARPIEPLPVALLGGLGTAALSAFILTFFHPFAVTFVDLAVHLLAIAIVVAVTALLNRRALSPA